MPITLLDNNPRRLVGSRVSKSKTVERNDLTTIVSSSVDIAKSVSNIVENPDEFKKAIFSEVLQSLDRISGMLSGSTTETSPLEPPKLVRSNNIIHIEEPDEAVKEEKPKKKPSMVKKKESLTEPKPKSNHHSSNQRWR